MRRDSSLRNTYVVMYVHALRTLHLSTLATKLFYSGTKLLQAIIVMQHYEPVSFKMLCHLYNIPTFITNVLILLVMKGG